MKRHPFLVLAAAGLMVGVGALSAPKQPQLLLLEWASRAPAEKPPLAVLIEMGLKDDKPTAWTGHARVKGARIVHREGYRFRKGDRLIEPDGWQASTHRPIALPRRNPALARTVGIDTVGVVLHLADVEPGATLTVVAKGKESEKAVLLADVLAGRARPLWDGTARVRLISTATPVVTAKTEDDFPAAACGPDGTLWVAYISYTVRDESRRIQQKELKEQPQDFKAFYTPEFADQLFVKYYRGGKWSEPIAITGPHEDLVRCAIAAEGNGTVWVMYNAHRKDKYEFCARPIMRKGDETANARLELGPERKWPADGLAFAACTDRAGHVRVVREWWRAGDGSSSSLNCIDGKWTEGLNDKGSRVDGQHFGGGVTPAIAAGPHGQTTEAYDAYRDGDYDVFLSVRKAADTTGNDPVAATPRFEARPSLAYDPNGRLWIAYEEGPEKWGKDYGALDAEDGNPLYNTRSVRVVCLADGKLFRPVAELPTSTSKSRHPDEKTPRYAYPQIGIDGKGRVWLTYRQKFGTRYSTYPGSYWLTFARRLDGDRWTEPIELHHSDGLLDSRPVLLPHVGGGLMVVHNTDGRYTTPEEIDNQIYLSHVDLPGEPVEPKLVPYDPGTKDEKQAEQENAGLRRIRKYRVESEVGSAYRLLRGEFHRHTELSWDGGPDGSLEDFFRYARDVAALDWIACTDHDNGAGREYPWWLTQKFTDAFRSGSAFIPVFGYERSVAYPHGHRNCLFAKRGVRTLPRLVEEDPEKRVAGVNADDTKMLYRYLRELDGICASHTSATGMGTDWRDNDPRLEPVVEIYQGDRMSYEYQGAPRAGCDPKSGKKPASIGGWQPAGFIDHALRKGYRLGFQSSSDHWSTHISFCIALVKLAPGEEPSREAIIEALKQRHSYAATDNIIADVRSGAHLMGDEFKTTGTPALQMTLIGTKPLARVEVLKDSEVVHTVRPGKQEYKATWTDPKPERGVHYYYVRVEQEDGELAWTSPMWIDHAGRE